MRMAVVVWVYGAWDVLLWVMMRGVEDEVDGGV